MAEDRRPRRPEIAERQQAITELTSSLDLREAIAVVGTDAARACAATGWSAWAEAPASSSRRIGFDTSHGRITAVFIVTLVVWLTTDNSTADG